MSFFNLHIDTDNAAFEDEDLNVEVARILNLLADKISSGSRDAHDSVFDINGNRVGMWAFGADGQPVPISEGMTLVVTGSPVDGLQFVGPFPDHWNAEKFTEKQNIEGSWSITELSEGL